MPGSAGIVLRHGLPSSIVFLQQIRLRRQKKRNAGFSARPEASAVTDPNAPIANALQLELLTHLGALGQQLGVVQGQLTHIIAEQSKERDDRREIYVRLNAVEQSAASSKGRLDELAPIVSRHEDTHQQARGAAWAMKLLWALFGGLFTLAGFLAAKFGLK